MRKSFVSIGAAALALITFGTSLPQAEAAPLRPVIAVDASTDVTPVRNRHGDEYNWRNGRPYYNGHRGYRHWRHGYRHHRGYWFPGAAFATGVIIGGAIASQPRVRVRPGLTREHIEYCMQRYRSYRAWDDTYQPNYGPRRRCIY
ncbi:BA14K family protein [Gellertiella hungarica]|uniref:Lectin-like protein BA14k n=1 Tax=Gellertiella hungarica TaxID=1572859 RepID=A0A7W6J360_9HYPH|nr:BA14K family protein [Gellertiella hungarica]MBB4063946.1 hypothetical protein [Gellertiella hungarica]